MNIYKFELKNLLRSFLLWSLSIFAIQIMFMAFYPSMSKDAATLDLILQNYPPELLQAFGFGEQSSLATVLGYYAFVFAFVQLCLAIQSAYYGFNLLSVEEREMTGDFLFTKPVKRSQILFSKYLAVMSVLFMTNIVIWLSTFLTLELFRDGKAYDIQAVIVLLLSVPLFQLFFISIGLLVTVMTKKIKSVLSYALALSFGLYILNALRGIVGGKTLGLVTPYYHFEPSNILTTGEITFQRYWLTLIIIVLGHLVCYLKYPKRNISTL